MVLNLLLLAEKTKAAPKQAPAKQPPVMAKAPAAVKKPPTPAAKGTIGKAPTPKVHTLIFCYLLMLPQGSVGSIANKFNKPNVTSPQPSVMAKQPSAANLKVGIYSCP